MSSRHLHLCVPGLLAMAPELLHPLPPTPALAQLLSRGSLQDTPACSPEAALLQAFLPDAAPPAAVPAAALTFLGLTGRLPDTPCALVSAIQLDVGRAGLVLARVLDDSLDEEEVQALMTSLQPVLAHHGLSWQRQGRYTLVSLPDRWPVPDLAPWQLLGQVIDPHLQRDQGLALHQLLNELQMALHHSEVNSRRLAAGRPPVTSLWLWGGAPVPPLARERWRRVVTDQPFLRGLALAAGATVLAPPRDLTGPIDGRELIYLQDFQHLPPDDPAPWHRQLLNFEQSYAAPLFAALRAGKVDSLSLHDPLRGRQLSLDARAARRWSWRRPGPGAVRLLLG